MKRFLLFVVITSSIINSLQAQDFSNKGKDFWVGYGYHQIMVAGNAQQMVLYFATESVTTVTVSIPGIGFTQTYSNIAANTIFETPPMPKAVGGQDARLLTEQLYDKGIHVTSDKPIVAYAHIYNASVSGATLLFPTITLGKEYYSVNYKNTSNSANANCWFYVLAADTGTTTVQITPSAATLTHAANVPFTVNLTQGQIYNVMGVLTTTTNPYQGVDLTGSLIKSVSDGANGCKRIAVFSGSGRISISCTAASSSSDNYMVQALPRTAWGKRFLTVPTAGNMTKNIFRVCVTDPTTVVKFNGNILAGPPTNNFYYEIANISTPSSITADKPIMVAQYITSQNSCGNGAPGDPEVIYLSALEQNINKVILNSTQHFNITQHFINVVLPNEGTGISTFRIDGALPASPFIVHPQNPSYSYLQQSVSVGQHTLRSDSGFNALAYGFGSTESYGYNAGSYVKDLYQFVGIITPYSIANEPSACANTPFYYSITLPYQPLSLLWNFHGFQTPNTINQPNPVADTTYFINGKQVWRYKLPTTNNYMLSGTYPVTVIANNPTPEGCSGEQTIDFDLNVYDPPNTKFYYQNNGCISDTVHFFDSTIYLANTYSYKWHWDFGDGTTDSVHNPIHRYSLPGTYNVSFSLLSNVGCFSDTAYRMVTVTLVPNANFGLSSPLCSGAPVTFTDSSIAYLPGALTKWYWAYGDGTVDTVLDNSQRIHTYSPYGPRTATLRVETASGCRSNLFSKTFMVNPIPVPDFTMPAGLCLPTDSAHFFDQSTIIDNTTPFTYLWDFGDAVSGINNNSTLKNPVHYYTSGGPFTISLHLTSLAGCSHDTSKILSNVYPQTHADFQVNNQYCLGDTTFFTDQTNIAPLIITNWYWDFGDGQNSTLQNPSHIYTGAGTYQVKHYIKSERGCYSDTMIKPVTINALPTARFGISGAGCIAQNITFSDSSVSSPGTITLWNWDLGDGTLLSLANGNPFTHSYNATGTYTVTLKVTSSTGCISLIYSKPVTIYSSPIPNFTASAVCLPNGTTQFTDQSTISDGTQSLFTYMWNFGDPGSGALNTSTLQNPPHHYFAVGPFNVKLIVTSSHGCIKDTTEFYNQLYGQPHANFGFTSSSQNCLNDSTHFIDSSNGLGGIVNEWHWNFGDGQLSSVQNPVHLYTTPGTFNVTLYIKTDKGCISDTMSKSITINPLPQARFGFSAPQCLNGVITLSDSSIANGGSITQWNWDLGDGTLLSLTNGNPFTHTYNSTGVFTVTLKVTSSTGCVSLVYSKPVTIYSLPVTDFSGSTVCLPNGTTQFTDLSTISDGTQSLFTWMWDFGDAASGALNTSTLQNPSHHYSSAGPFNVKLIVTSSHGCAKDTTKTYNQVYAQPHANFVFTLNSQNCLNDSTHFIDSSNGFGGTVNEWHWNFGDGQTSTVQNPVHLYATPATYIVTLYVKTNKGCLSDTMTKSVTITPLPQARFGFSFPQCLNGVITFTDSSLANGGSITQWNWDLGDGTLLNLTNGNPFPHVYANAGIYNVILKVTTNSGCVSLVSLRPVTIHQLPVPNFGVTSVCLPSGIAYFLDSSTIADGTQSSFTYLWNFGDPSSGTSNNSTLRNPQHRYTTTGPYNIKLTVTSGNGCTKDTTKQLTQIYPQPHALFNVASENCLHDTTYFTDSSLGAGGTVNEWHWNFGDGQTSTVQNPFHIYLAAGIYNVTLYIKTNNGCISDTFPQSVTINLLPTVSFSVSTPLCETRNITFTNSSVANAGNITTWNWDMGDGTLLTLTSGAPFTHIYATTGTYVATLSVQTNKGCTGTPVSHNVIIHPLPVANFVLPGVCLSDAFAQFLDSSYIADGTDSSFTYLWNFGDPSSGGLNTSTLKNPTHKYLAAGLYAVTITVTSINGCMVSKTKQLSVNGTVPRANFTVVNPGSLCSNTAVQIQDMSSVQDFGIITRIEIYWDFANTPTVFNAFVNPAPSQLYNHLYPNFQSPLTKTYTIKLRAFSGGTCVNEKVQTVVVNATPKVLFNSLPDTCLYISSFQITQASETGNVPGSGVFSGPGVSGSGLFDPSAAGVGAHVIRYTFTSNKGCVDFKEQTINITAPPVAKFGFSSPRCVTNDVTFSDSSNATGAGITKWTWDFGDGSSAVVRTSGVAFTHSFGSAQTYNVTLTVTTGAGCNSTPYTLAVNVSPLPIPGFKMPRVCLPGGQAKFTDSSRISDGTAGQFSYLWDFGDPSSGVLDSDTSRNPTHVYSAVGPYSVQLTVTSSSGCVRDTVQVYNDIHPQPHASFVGDPLFICAGGTVGFNSAQSNGMDGSIVSYNWSFGDGGTDTRSNPTHIFNNAGNYNVQLYEVNSQGCNSDTARQGITVYAYPTVNGGGNVSVLQGGTITLHATAAGTQLQYLWTPAINLSNATTLTPVATGGPEDQTYKLTVSGQGGCASVAYVLVKVLKFPVIPNTFTPNNDGINDKWVIDHLDNYPDCHVQVFNRYGQIVFESKGYGKPWDGTMNGKALPWGTYYYVIEPGSGRKPVTGYVTLIK